MNMDADNNAIEHVRSTWMDLRASPDDACQHSVMRKVSKAVVVLVAATAVLCGVIPAKQAISVGDDVSAVRRIGLFYGCPISHFSVVRRDADGNPLHPTAYALGDDWQLLIWHSDRVRAMTHFKYVSKGEHRYGDWVDVADVESFDVPRPGVQVYLVGLALLCLVGFATHRFRRISRIVLGILLLLVVLVDLLWFALAETVAIFPICVSLGWIAAYLLGANIGRIEPSTNVGT